MYYFIFLGCSITMLSRNSLINISSYKDCFKILLCETPSENCFFGRCDQCPNKTKLQDLFEELFEENEITSIKFK